jgi:hypothetical protein
MITRDGEWAEGVCDETEVVAHCADSIDPDECHGENEVRGKTLKDLYEQVFELGLVDEAMVYWTTDRFKYNEYLWMVRN